MEISREKIEKLGLKLIHTYKNLPIEEFGQRAREFAKRLRVNQTVLFFGELGTGKTTFIRRVLEMFGVDRTEVRSPTFNIVNTYTKDGIEYYHMDVYRIEPQELFELGFFDYQKPNSIVFVEWAEKIVDEISSPDHIVSLCISGEDLDKRDITIYSKEP